MYFRRRRTRVPRWKTKIFVITSFIDHGMRNKIETELEGFTHFNNVTNGLTIIDRYIQFEMPSRVEGAVEEG